jgi:hypothetical protein
MYPYISATVSKCPGFVLKKKHIELRADEARCHGCMVSDVHRSVEMRLEAMERETYPFLDPNRRKDPLLRLLYLESPISIP